MENELYLIEGDGRRRRAEKAVCEYCDNGFLRRLNGKKRFCTPQCHSLNQRKRIKLTCTNCSKVFERKICRTKVTKNEVYFCSRKCKDYAQSIEGGCKDIQAPHYGTGLNIEYRKTAMQKLEVFCVQCNETRRYRLVVHHIDGDRSNNSIENLEWVCGSCHRVRHMRRDQEQGWIFNSSCLTPRDLVFDL